MKFSLFALAMAALATPALAQQGVARGDKGEAHVLQLEMQSLNKGYAVIVDGDGHEHHCEARLTDEAVDLGPCRPLRLVTPLKPEPKRQPQVQTVNPAKMQVTRLFEENRCSLSYADLSGLLQKLGARQREALAKTIAEMTAAGEIVDDQRTERATLKAGARCR